MAVPARRDDSHTWPIAPALRLIRGEGRRRRGPVSRTAARSDASCRRNFAAACVVLAILALVGMGRVALTVQAAEAAVAANSLAQDIEAERIAMEQLEEYRSALVAPPRIKTLAESSMGMGAAQEVSYIELSGGGEAESVSAVRPQGEQLSDRAQTFVHTLSAIIQMTAGEARVLLAGDAALASSR